MGLPQAQVEVDANGRPPAPPPPEGSYADMARQEVISAQEQLQQAVPAPPPPVVAPTEPQQLEQQTNEPSEKASDRISDLVSKLRTKDQEFQQLQAQHTQTAGQIAEMKQLVESLRSEREQLKQAALESLDPEERARVIGQMELQNAVQQAQEKLLSTLQPRLAKIDEHELAREFESLSLKYPGFNPQVHPELIQHVRSQNPALSVELAFRAVASNDELGVSSARSANPVPPSLAPNQTGVPRSVPSQAAPQNSSTPEQEIQDESAAAYKLLRSKDSADQKAGMRAVDAVLGKRIFGA
jgi:uncharacterized protein YdcH (DUF465 family)